MPRPTRSQLAAYAVIGVLVLVLGGHWLLGRSGGGAGASSYAETSPSGTSSPASSGPSDGDQSDGGASTVAVSAPSRSAVVHVAGAVRHPGVYRLGPGARVQDAVRRAGGPTRHGDVNAINLAAVVQDGVQVVVPRRGAAGAATAVAAVPGADGAPAATGPPVDLNTATAEQLDTLDGVGPATAQKILEYRQQHGGFRTVDDLAQVPGIGPKKLAALRGKVQV